MRGPARLPARARGCEQTLCGICSKRLDRAAEHAARQWRFEPKAHRVLGKPLWVVVRIEFAPPQLLLGVPILIVPYAAVARRVGLLGPADRELRVPRAATAVRWMLRGVLAVFSKTATGNTPAGSVPTGSLPTGSLPTGESIAAQLAAQGPVKSIRFLGELRHGIAHDRTGLRGGGLRVRAVAGRCMPCSKCVTRRCGWSESIYKTV